MANELMEVPMEVELLNTTIEKVGASGYVSVPLTEISSYGIVGDELSRLINTIKNPGGEGIYRVSFPEGVKGTLSRFKNEDAFFGTIKSENSFAGQARLKQVTFNPEQVFMALALLDMGTGFLRKRAPSM